MMITEEMIAEDEKRWYASNIIAELGYCGNNIRHRKTITNDDIRFYAYIMRKAWAMLKEQAPIEPIKEEIEQAGPLYHRCYCKKCGHHVGNMIRNKVTEAHENYCSSCGQAVKWDE